ncbi:hyaluronidase PH-20-like isoform X1 [Perca flavescens]|uniref:hyaluronidase PH-20-like isoform X1 n=2 Tax=Perca flavescens TaxID=8167 RepID=UPI00106EAFD0|nr:hyaluronidase PH-20-like isoform X1 [Perca flavescens]
MVSFTQKSRSCVLLLLSLTPSIFPLLPTSILPALTSSVWPALSLCVLTTPKAFTPPLGDTNISTTPFTTPAILKSSTSTISPTSSSEAYTTTHSKSTSATSTMSPSVQTSPRCLLISSPSAYLLHHPCKRLTSPLKTIGPPLHKNQKCHLSKKTPVSSEKHPLHTSKQYPPSNSTSPPKMLSSSPLPQTASPELPSPVSTSSLSTAFLPLTSEASPPSFAKTSPIPLPETTTSPPEAAASRQPVPLPPPPLPHTTGPMFEHQPFIVSWNIPDLVCSRFNITLDSSPFKGVATPAKVPGQFLSLFYTDRLGLYPHVDLTSRKQFNGGIPQRGNLKASINKARADINYYIPSKTSRGLAVIDWEEWRPLWDRNWGPKRIYQTLSVAHLMQTNRSLTVQQATEKAKQQFQVAAKSFMSGMLAMGRAMRPNYLWGFYLFPNCYNYGWEKPDYTGRCSNEVRRQNDELLWLWESSTALYPSVYLQVFLADNPRAAMMVRNRIKEALRVSALPRRSGTAPVFAYMRPVFVDQNRRFLSQGDLVSTIGESAAVGVSGAVLWGASADYDDQTSCAALSSYLSTTLNPYITNVTAAAQLCSNFLCRGNGRCVRKNYNSSHYLHLNPENFRILHVQKRYLVLGRPTLTDLKALSRRFTCQCYKGLICTPRTYGELAKALIFSLNQGLYQKFHTLNKAMLDDTQQTSISKDNVKKNFKV